MGRPRKNPDDWLPPRVYRHKDGYRWQPKGGGSVLLLPYQRDRHGCLHEPVGVQRRVIAAFEQAAKAYLAPEPQQTLSAVLEEYFRSREFLRKSKNTQDDYRHYAKKITFVFGHMEPRRIKRSHIRSFMDDIAAGGAEVQANRHSSFLSTLLGWAYDRDYVDNNVAFRMSKFPETPRDRYVEDWELDLVYTLALERGYAHMAAIIELAYLCRIRGIEARALTLDSLTPDGVTVIRTKGSRPEVTGWSPRLRAAVDLAMSTHRPGIVTKALIRSPKGGRPISKAAYRSAHTRLLNWAIEEGIEVRGQRIKLKERFGFHDLKAKGVTDHKDKEGGHRSKKMQAVYDRLPNIIEATR